MSGRRARVDELAVISPFVRPDRLARLERALGTTAGRRAFTAALAEFDDFDPRWRRHVPAACQHAPGLAMLLRRAGSAERCLVLSENPAWHRRHMPLPVILSAALWSGLGTLVVCEPGRLAYFEGANPSVRCILERCAHE